MNRENAARLSVIGSMLIYGTIGVFVRYIPMPSAVIAMARGLIGAPFLLLVLFIKRSRPDMAGIKRNLSPLLVLGALLGTNWVLLFESYRYTSVAAATLCYYLAPILLVAASPFLFKERLSARKVLCVLAALVGMVLVSGVLGGGAPGSEPVKGMALAVGAAAMYACIVVLNKKLSGISAYDRTISQLAVSSVVMLVYNLFSGSLSALSLDGLGWIMLLVVGIVHTGLAYFLYFGSMEALSAQTLAILSYIDPVTAVLLSALLLKEPLGVGGVIGAVLILGSAVISELPLKNKEEQK